MPTIIHLRICASTNLIWNAITTTHLRKSSKYTHSMNPPPAEIFGKASRRDVDVEGVRSDPLSDENELEELGLVLRKDVAEDGANAVEYDDAKALSGTKRVNGLTSRSSLRTPRRRAESSQLSRSG